MYYRHACFRLVGYFVHLFGVKECGVFYSDIEDITGSLTSKQFVQTNCCFLLVNVLRVLVSVSFPLLNWRRAAAQNLGHEHGKKIMFSKVSESDLSSAARHNAAASLRIVKRPEGLLCLFSIAHGLFIILFFLEKYSTDIKVVLVDVLKYSAPHCSIFFFICILQNLLSLFQCPKRTNLLQSIAGFVLSHLF